MQFGKPVSEDEYLELWATYHTEEEVREFMEWLELEGEEEQ